jgi:hypothetical protein
MFPMALLKEKTQYISELFGSQAFPIACEFNENYFCGRPSEVSAEGELLPYAKAAR